MTTDDAFTDRLSDYLDDELGEADRRALEQHLAGCDDCRVTLSELRAVVARAASLPDRAPDVDLWFGVAQRIGPGRRSNRRFSFTFSFTLPQLAAAVLAVIVLSTAAIWVARRRPRRKPHSSKRRFPAMRAATSAHSGSKSSGPVTVIL